MTSAKAQSTRAARIDRLMEQASEALVATRYFECERLAVEALSIARSSRDFERMSRILLPLQEARRQKRQAASDTRKIFRIDAMDKLEPLLSGQKKLTPGCYLIEPSLVGADGRDLREKADSLEVPIIVVVREPPTRLGLWPVVMVGPVTVRTRIRPPAKGKPDLAWVLSAGEALGDEAIRMVDRALDPADRVQRLADALATVVDHEKLHQELAAACREAAQQEAQARSESGGRRGRRASAAAEPDAFDDEDDED